MRLTAPGGLTHPSIADIPEASFVEQLIKDPYWRSCLLGIEGIPEVSTPLLNVPLTDLPGGLAGDVDILLCPSGRPDLATTIQAKRVKVRNDRLNKLREFEKGVRQANRLAKIGFWQVYLFVLVVADSREQNAGRISYEGPTPRLRSVIEQAISAKKLNPRVGLMHYEFVQPMDNVPLLGGTHSAHLVRLAKPAEQSTEVTAWVGASDGHRCTSGRQN